MGTRRYAHRNPRSDESANRFKHRFANWVSSIRWNRSRTSLIPHSETKKRRNWKKENQLTAGKGV